MSNTTAVIASLVSFKLIEIVNDVLLSSDEDEIADEFEQSFILGVGSKANPRKRVIPRCKNYYESVVPKYNFREFQMHFRFSRVAFEALCEKIVPIILVERKTGHPFIDIEKKILAVIWLLATPDSYRSVANRFDLGKSSLADSFMRVIRALNKIAPIIIKWPEGEDINLIKEKFKSFGGLNNVIGAVDGTYIPIKAPDTDPEIYITRKCQYAFTLQCIAEPSLKFIDCFIGYPGSVGDRRLFSLSYIYRNIQNDVHRYFDEESFIIGDKAYPLLKWCIPPYLENRALTPNEVYFNRIHSKTRQVVERSFSLLFGRFRRLKFLDLNRTDLIPSTVLACCVLHNICLHYEDLLIADYVMEGRQFVLQDEEYQERRVEQVEVNATNKRDRICLSLLQPE